MPATRWTALTDGITGPILFYGAIEKGFAKPTKRVIIPGLRIER
jgi:hypothetical protein